MEQLRMLKDKFYGFCTTTSIHGLRNVGDDATPKTPTSRVAWFITVVISFAFAGINIYNSYVDWTSNPVMIRVETTDYPVENIPFPAITICRKDADPNRMAFAAKVLDHVKFPCYDDDPTKTDCNVTRAALAFLDPLFLELHEDLLMNLTSKLNDEKMIINFNPFTNFSQSHKAYWKMVVVLATKINESYLQDLQIRMLTQAGVMPGRFDDMFEGLFNPEIRKLLTRDDLKRAENVTEDDCYKDPKCQRFLYQAKSFIYKIYFLFPRPFFRLGTLISLFEYKIFPNSKTNMRPLQKQLYGMLADILSEYYDRKVANVPLTDLASWGTLHYLGSLKRPNYTLAYANCTIKDYVNLYLQLFNYTNGLTDQLPCPVGSGPCCNLSSALVRDNFEFFLDYMRLSSSKRDKGFFEKYVKKLPVFKKLNLSLIEQVDDLSPDMLVHCEFIAEFINIDRDKLGCKKFHQVPTPYGLCHSYNILSPSQLFKESEYSQHLDNVFKWKVVEDLEHPSGHGSSHGFYIILSSFEVSSYQRVTKDFIVSFSNAHNYFNIDDHSYTVKPGNLYTFSIIPSQVPML